ncbi:MAG TPA: FeoA family protein [Longimicrobiaceae bacterium]|jgi:Fe2+ transport system protein FeoA
MAAHPRPAAAPLHSLAEAAPGDLVEVVHILFGSLRQRFDDLGIRPGTRMRVRERGAAGYVLELPGGATAAVDPVHAAFVEVQPSTSDISYRGLVPTTRHLTVDSAPDRPRPGDATANPRIA